MLRGISISISNALILACVLLACPLVATAQRHGGGGSNLGGGINGNVSGNNRPTGLDEKDSLKDFHEVLAVQASSEQITEFQALVKSTEAAQSDLQAFLQSLRKKNAAAAPARRDALDPALEKARNENKKFQEGLFEAQKAGLKDISKRLAKADSDLEQEEKKLDQSLDLKSPTGELVTRAESLDKALTDFYNEQLALGREMSITMASGQDLAFMLPKVKTLVSLNHRTIPVETSGLLSQIAAQGDQRTFKLEMIADLSDLQQNITDLLRAQIETSPTCGERLGIRRSRLTPADPASLLVLWLHYERWICNGTPGREAPTELAEGDGTVEIKLTASVEKPNTLKVSATFGRIDATGMFGDALRSGSLGDDLKDQIAQSMLSAVRAGLDFKTTLPAALQSSTVIQSAKFQDLGVGGLIVVLQGQIDLSNQQSDQLASQLNQALSAQGTATR
ncbi:MAG: hypothetical protein ABSE44_04990 [Candidatus Sulfotelmatobacter sp.]|jgi:hypothetical protein